MDGRGRHTSRHGTCVTSHRSHVQKVSFFHCDCIPIQMFGRFVPSEDVTGSNQAKSSVVRGIRTRLVEQYPPLDSYIDEIIPKKEPVAVLKWFDI